MKKLLIGLTLFLCLQNTHSQVLTKEDSITLFNKSKTVIENTLKHKNISPKSFQITIRKSSPELEGELAFLRRHKSVLDERLSLENVKDLTKYRQLLEDITLVNKRIYGIENWINKYVGYVVIYTYKERNIGGELVNEVIYIDFNVHLNYREYYEGDKYIDELAEMLSIKHRYLTIPWQLDVR